MPQFILIDHALMNLAGHHYEYARSVLEAAADVGYRPLLAAHRDLTAPGEAAWDVRRAYRFGVWLHQGAPAPLVRIARLASAFRRRRSAAGGARRKLARRGFARRCFDLLRRRQFTRDTTRLLQEVDAAEGDAIFLPTMSWVELAALARLMRRRGVADGAAWHLLFRRDMFDEGSLAAVERQRRADELRTAFARFIEAASGRTVRLYTDSARLTSQYQDVTGLEFTTLPIPHTWSPNEVRDASAGAFRVCFVGDARMEKGYHHLPHVVKTLTDERVDQEIPHFVIQSSFCAETSERCVAEARSTLAGLAERGVQLIEQPLGTAEYRQLVGASDLTLLPYDQRAYRRRSSGVYVESLAAGVPVIVPAGTWMARHLPPGAGLAYDAVEQIPDLVRRVMDRRGAFRQAAREAAVAWRARHNAPRLVELLLGDAQASGGSRRPPEQAKAA